MNDLERGDAMAAAEELVAARLRALPRAAPAGLTDDEAMALAEEIVFAEVTLLEARASAIGLGLAPGNLSRNHWRETVEELLGGDVRRLLNQANGLAADPPERPGAHGGSRTPDREVSPSRTPTPGSHPGGPAEQRGTFDSSQEPEAAHGGGRT